MRRPVDDFQQRFRQRQIDFDRSFRSTGLMVKFIFVLVLAGFAYNMYWDYQYRTGKAKMPAHRIEVMQGPLQP